MKVWCLSTKDREDVTEVSRLQAFSQLGCRVKVYGLSEHWTFDIGQLDEDVVGVKCFSCGDRLPVVAHNSFLLI